MTPASRKPRPLQRDQATFRDDRLFIVACDDTYAPKQYFEFFRLPRIQVHVVTTEDGSSSAMHVLNRLSNVAHLEHDERWMLLDTDHCIQGGHVATFTQAIKEAQEAGIQVALSRPSFELWLLLHHVDETCVAALTNAAKTEAQLRAELGTYDKRRLDEEKFPVETVADACERAMRLDDLAGGGDIPSGPASRVYRLWASIIDKVPVWQLPASLGRLKK